VFYYFFYRTSVVKKLLQSVAILVLIAVAICYVPGVVEKLSYFRLVSKFQGVSAKEPLQFLTSGRTEIWRAAAGMIYDNPISGIGPDMWSQYIWRYSMPIFPNKTAFGKVTWVYAYDPHNLCMLIWLNYGIVALICYLVIVFSAIREGVKRINAASSGPIRDISIGTFITLIIWMFVSLFTMRFYNHSILLFALLFWSIIAIIFKLHEISPPFSPDNA
jgi:O-antigen ligase